jgi:hypothetical protein
VRHSDSDGYTDADTNAHPDSYAHANPNPETALSNKPDRYRSVIQPDQPVLDR